MLCSKVIIYYATHCRISGMMSDQLTDNNPNIANLSDPNRPSIIADKFSELYNNEWTEAYIGLTDSGANRSEEETITLFLDILQVIFRAVSTILIKFKMSIILNLISKSNLNI